MAKPPYLLKNQLKVSVPSLEIYLIFTDWSITFMEKTGDNIHGIRRQQYKHTSC